MQPTVDATIRVDAQKFQAALPTLGARSFERKDERVVLPMLAAEEDALWVSGAEGEWRRAPNEHAPCGARLRVAPSAIAGKGLFACSEMTEGTRLGRLSGRVLIRGERDACEEWAASKRSKRSVLLRDGEGWAVVDVAGSVFEWANHSERETLHVSERGEVEVATDVVANEELVWDYGDRFGLARGGDS